MIERQERYSISFIAAASGTAVVALCCFTLLLVTVFGIVGLSFLTPYPDYVLLLALMVLLASRKGSHFSVTPPRCCRLAV